jgi:murein DD-endopeptidase MepM/ murein hydrolase activator NlpD
VANPAPQKVAAVTPVDEEPEDTRSLGGSPQFRWPVRGKIISGYGAKTNGQHNDGINLSVPEGTEIKAAENGVVAYSGTELKGYGNLVLLRHADGWMTAYAHNSQLLVKRGDQVRRGQPIARAGQTGGVSSPQVHFEIRKGSTPVDPTQYLSAL